MFMLPIRGRPFGHGGYNAVFLWIRDAMQSNDNINGIVNKRVSWKHSSAVFSSRSKFMVGFLFFIFWFSIFHTLLKKLFFTTHILR